MVPPATFFPFFNTDVPDFFWVGSNLTNKHTNFVVVLEWVPFSQKTKVPFLFVLR